MKKYRVIGVFHWQQWGEPAHHEEVERLVEADYADMAISIVDCEALKEGKLFNSAVAVEVR